VRLEGLDLIRDTAERDETRSGYARDIPFVFLTNVYEVNVLTPLDEIR
jgi:hypothetical protein